MLVVAAEGSDDGCGGLLLKGRCVAGRCGEGRKKKGREQEGPGCCGVPVHDASPVARSGWLGWSVVLFWETGGDYGLPRDKAVWLGSR